jgi:N-acetylneuraminic acid mutarotase
MKKNKLFLVVFFFCFLHVGMAFAAPDTWTQKTDFGGVAGTQRVDAVGFSIGSKGYVGTGYDGSQNTLDFWEYDSVSDTWTQKADFGGTARQAAVGFAIENKGYVGTGYDGVNTRDFWEYDPSSNTWTQKADFGGTARYNAVGFSIGNRGYIGTGYDGSYKKDLWEYNPAEDEWTQKATLESGFGGNRSAAVGFSIGGKGYVGSGVRVDLLLGFIPFTVFLQDFYEYDPATDSWTMKASLPEGARFDAIGFSIGDKGFIGMGFIATDSTVYYKDLWEYDPSSNLWTQKADFGDAADPEETGRRAAIGFSISSKGYVGTGLDGSIFRKDFWEYDSGINTIPDSFIFTDQTDVALNTVITSNTITVSGIAAPAYITITGGTYSINGGDYTSDNGTVEDGDEVTVRLTSSGNYSTTTGATLTIGGVSDTFSITTEAAPVDMTPDAFMFIDQTGVELNTVITSNAITVSGITAATPISITGGTYSINGGDYTSVDGTVEDGDEVTVRLVSSSSYFTSTYATLTIGGISDTFSVTTRVFTSGDNCFIATAAFGTPLAKQVQILRDFRDGYLLTNVWGRKFVQWYYSHGPAFAHYIQDKPLAKTAIRTALHPFIGVAFLLVNGFLPFVAIGFLLSTLVFMRIRTRES